MPAGVRFPRATRPELDEVGRGEACDDDRVWSEAGSRLHRRGGSRFQQRGAGASRSARGAGRVHRAIREQFGHFFLDIDDELRFPEALLKTEVVGLKAGKLDMKIEVGLATGFFRKESIIAMGVVEATPLGETGGVDAFFAEESGELTWFCAGLSFAEDAKFVVRGEDAAWGSGLGSGPGRAWEGRPSGSPDHPRKRFLLLVVSPSMARRGWKRYPTLRQMWRRRWEEVKPFLAYPEEIRK